MPDNADAMFNLALLLQRGNNAGGAPWDCRDLSRSRVCRSRWAAELWDRFADMFRQAGVMTWPAHLMKLSP
jgi:hypothetical protein